MKKLKVTFVAVRDRQVVRKVIPIEHNFDVLPPVVFNGKEFPATSIEEQVMDMLLGKDLSRLMRENEFDLIIDYFPTPERKRREKDWEEREFAEYCKTQLQYTPSLAAPFQAIVARSRKILFGHGKSNKTKFKEVSCMVDIAMEMARGTIIRLCEAVKDDRLQKETMNAIESGK